MTEPDSYDDSNDNGQQGQDDGDGGGRNWKLLREKADKYDELVKETEPLRLENAFLKAGIPDTPQGRLLQMAYKGEPTVEAIRKFAAEHDVIDATDLEIPAAELESMDRADAASQGGSFTPPRPPDMNAQLRAAAGR